MSKKYSWDFLLQFHLKPPGMFQLKRSIKVQKEYDKYQENPFNNIIFSKNLFYNNDIFMFIKNRFPYNIEYNISHYVLFINPKLKKKFTEENINIIIKRLFVPFNSFIVFENYPQNRSIKNITHYHVFILNNIYRIIN